MEKFMIYTEKSVRGTLERLHELNALRERGNLDAIVTLLDMKKAISSTTFTMRQAQVLKLHYLHGFTVKETCEKLGIDHSTVASIKKVIAKKVYNELIGGKVA